jgi:hypothetical protein
MLFFNTRISYANVIFAEMVRCEHNNKIHQIIPMALRWLGTSSVAYKKRKEDRFIHC